MLGSLLVIAGGSGPRRETVFTARPVRWLGDVSFSLYLWHWPVVVMLGVLAPDAPGVIRVVVAVGTACLLADMSRRWVERPFIAGRWRALRSWRLAIASVTAIALSVATAGVGQLAYHTKSTAMAHAAQELEEAPPSDIGAAAISADGYAAFATGSPRGVIAPNPLEARAELPEGADGRCKSDMGSATTPVCEFGSADASFSVALVGDSHMEQYLPAFQQLADEHDWHLITYLHSSCPWSMAQRVTDANRGGPCLKANEQTYAALQEQHPDLVVTSSRTAVSFVDGEGVPDPVTGFRQAWQRFTDEGIPVAVIADNPLMLADDATNECVVDNPDDPSVCDRPRKDAMPTDWQREALESPLDGVTMIDLTDNYCTKMVCPAVAGSTLIYRDEQHVTPAYMRTLSPFLYAALQRGGVVQ